LNNPVNRQTDRHTWKHNVGGGNVDRTAKHGTAPTMY